MEDVTIQFQAVAEEHRKKERRRLKIVLWFVVSCLVGIVIGNTDSAFPKTAWYLNLAAIVIAFVANWYRPLCPSCRHDVTSRLSQRCPECGGALDKGGAFKRQQCQGCGLRPQSNRTGRNYRIKHCTNCGAKLSEIGI